MDNSKKSNKYKRFCLGESFYLSTTEMDNIDTLLFKVKKFIIGELKKGIL